MNTLRILGAVVLLGSAGSAAGQGWIGKLTQKAGRVAVAAGSSGSAAPSPSPDASRSAAPAGPAGAAAPLAKVAPVPVRLEYPKSDDPRDLRFSQADKDAKKAFADRSEVACNDCEGLKTYEAWARHQLPGMSRTGALDARIGEMAIGEALTWRGRTTGTNYAITVISAEPVAGFGCKQVRWSAAKGGDTFDRLGLFCWFERGQRWEEIL